MRSIIPVSYTHLIEKAEDDKTEYENEGHYEGVIFK